MAQTSNAASSTQSAFQRIMLAVDDSEATLRAAEYTKALFAGRAQITLVTVAQNPRTLFPLGATAQGFLAAAREEIIGDARAALAKIEAIFAGIELEFGLVDLSVHHANTADALLDTASHWNADLLVMGMRHHHGLLRWIEGTVSEPVTRRATCSLLLVPEDSRVPTDRPPTRMVFALDGSACSLAGLRTGLKIAGPDTRLRTIYVVDRAVHLFDGGAADMLETAYLDQGCAAIEGATHICSDQGCIADTAVIKTHRSHDDVPHAIVRDAAEWNADLVVLGTHGRRGIERWLLGSVAARTVRLVDTPILLARSGETAAD